MKQTSQIIIISVRTHCVVSKAGLQNIFLIRYVVKNNIFFNKPRFKRETQSKYIGYKITQVDGSCITVKTFILRMINSIKVTTKYHIFFMFYRLKRV